MEAAGQFAVVLVTAPDLKSARSLARSALEARLVACANLIPKVESHYWWQSKVESSSEVLMILKTTRGKLKRLECLILDLHPYDTPEFLAFSLTAGTKRYLAWLSNSLHLG